jgi:hypothetical protein
MRRIAWLVAVFAAVGGCYSPKGETVLKYDKGGAAHTMRAPEDGEYALIAAASQEKPQVVKLRRGELLGFRKYKDGGVAAVAGEREIPVKVNESYRWRRD